MYNICASTLITCVIIMSRRLLPCDFTQVWQLFRCLLCVATMSSSRWILRSRGNVDMMTQGWPRAEMPEASSYLWCLHAESLTNIECWAARRALEWIRTSKARLVFRYEISDLFFFAVPSWSHYRWKCSFGQAFQMTASFIKSNLHSISLGSPFHCHSKH